MPRSTSCERTQRIIINSFLTLLESKNYEDINVGDICEDALITRATFYNYFEDKLHLFTCILESYKENLLLDKLDNYNFSTPKELFMTIAKLVIEYLYERRERISKLLRNCKNEQISNLFSLEIDRNIKIILKDQLDKFEYAVPIPILSKFYSGGLISLTKYLLEENENYTVEEILSFFDVMLNENTFKIKDIINKMKTPSKCK